MRNTILSLPLLLMLQVLAPLASRPVGSPKFVAKETEITASDLASALGVRHWSYHLRFDGEVSGMAARPCELQRRPDGTWQRSYLAGGMAVGFDKKLREVKVVLFMYDTPDGSKYALRVHETFSRGKMERAPDFTETYYRAGHQVEGCLIVAIQEKDPREATGRVENFARVIGLEIIVEN